MIKDTNKSFFDLYSSTGEYARRYPVPNLYSYSIIKRFVKEHDLICDIGCGNGRYIIPLITENHKRMIGIDISEEMINELRGHLEDHHLSMAKVDLINDDMENIELENDSLDVALCMFGTLSHFNPPEKRNDVLRKVYGALKPGGRFIGSVPNRYRRFYRSQLKNLWQKFTAGNNVDMREITYYRDIDGRKYGNYYYLFTPEEIREELASSGFEDIELHVESLVSERHDIRYSLHRLSLRPLLLCSQILFVCRKPFLQA